MKKDAILIVDDQPEILNSLQMLLKNKYDVYLASNGNKALHILRETEIAVILADQRMPGMTGVEFLARSIEIQPDAVRMLITAYTDIQASIAAINQGQIFYYISKPWEPDELMLNICRAMERFQLVKENKRLTEELIKVNKKLEQENIILKKNIEKYYDFSNIIGNSPRMLQVFKLVSKVIDTSTTVLLLGETGTGKELLAKAIHYNSGRKNKMFIAQNCGALPDSLLESELFGHVKGAFTGATSNKKGIFEVANGGTVFLDEIADTSAALQLRLLRVLQENEVKPVGGIETIKVDLRIIAATNKNLEDEVKAGRFREDLYYRLNVFPVVLPPLRERKEDISDLIEYFIKKYAAKIKKTVPYIKEDAKQILIHAPFPGNIRELENEIERSVTLADDNAPITVDLLSSRFQREVRPVDMTSNGSDSLKSQVENLEMQMIRDALEKTNGNILKAAKILRLSRVGLYKKIKRYKITDPRG
jgi:two-component system response regulator HupR/HoxA